jgi:hypothetical protein
MAKDFAVLFNIDKWLKATAGMDADARGWYVNLLLHQYDKNGLPNNVEDLALLAGVRFSEYQRFEQVFEQVLKQKFVVDDDGKLRNPYMTDVLSERVNFQKKRSLAGKVSAGLRKIRIFEGYDKGMDPIFTSLVTEETDTKSEQVLQQMFEICSERLRSRSIDINYSYNEGGVGETETDQPIQPLRYIDQFKPQPKFKVEHIQELPKQTLWYENVIRAYKISPDDFNRLVDEFISHCHSQGKDEDKTERDLKSHFTNWLGVKQKNGELKPKPKQQYKKFNFD